jgi:hypothetical protein
MNQSALNIALQEMLENERKQIEFFKAALKCQPEPLETLESIIEQERTKREAEE